MADPFTQKFVDLVRNYTTTTGTADFKLGPAVNGYSGFASALQTGDSFYYSAIGVDKPAEREVGRGTLTASGTITREPIGGAKTNFTTGTKSIALIAAAQWFSAVQAAASASMIAPSSAASQNALGATTARQVPALLTAPGREGLFVWDGSNLSAMVAADPNQGVYIAPTSDTTGASGAWVRKYGGTLNVKWFGAKGDATTDDYPAIQAAIDFGASTGVAIFFPRAVYRCSARLVSNAPVRLTGEFAAQDAKASSWPAAALGSTIYFDAGTGGLYGRYATSSDLSGAADIPGSGGSIIEFLRFQSAGGGTVAAGKHGIEFRGTVRLRHVVVRGFGDHGVYIRGSLSGGDGVVFGNVNSSHLSRVASIGNGGDGFKLSGNDANGIMLDTCHAQSNAGWGFTDDGFINNTHLNGLTEGNALGAWRTLRAAAVHSFIGCNDEGATSSLGAGCFVRGGTLGQRASGQTHQMRGNVWAYDGITVRSGNFVQLNNAADSLALSISNDGTNILFAGPIKVGGSTIRFTGFLGTIATDGTNFVLNAPLKITNVVFNAAGVLQAAAFPALTGDVTTTAGSLATSLASSTVVTKLAGQAIAPASVGASGAITSAGGGIGYASGAGGVVTQATSKSTGVTINKLCGQITTTATALAANTGVSFAVANSQVAATDTIDLVLASGNAGAGTYNYQVDKVSAGSFVVWLKNISAGSLSEALVFNFSVKKAVNA